jgi:hypothetical protein
LEFLYYGIAALIFGMIFLFLTEFYLEIIGWPFSDPTLARVLGAALLGFWILQWLSFKENEW